MILLLTLLFAPLVGILFLSFLDKESKKSAKKTALFFSLVPALLLIGFNKSLFVNEVKFAWIPQFHIYFHLGIDPISFLFIALTSFIVPIVIGYLASNSWSRLSLALVLTTESFLIAFFATKDLFLFILFWEAMLLPLFFAIYLYGGEERKKAAFQFLLYMMGGSLLLIVAALFLYFETGTFDIEAIGQNSSKIGHSTLLFWIFMAAFLVKAPLFPFHGWLPLAYLEAPIWGTILLSALLSKAALFGVVRIIYTFFPQELLHFSPLLLSAATMGVLYGALIAFSERNIKKIIAYSSLSHLNFILAALFTDSEIGHMGALLQAVNHGVIITALFMMAGYVFERTGSYSIDSARGLTAYFPHLGWATLFFVVSGVALPGTGSFIGELLMIVGIYSTNAFIGVLLLLSLLLTLLYMLRFYENLFQGTKEITLLQHEDIGQKAWVATLPLIMATLWLGIYPAPLFTLLEEALAHL